MKKALLYGLALVFALSLSACNRPKEEQPTQPDPAPSTSAPADTSAQEPAATPETVKDTTPEPVENTAPEPEPEQTPAAPVETEDTRPPEETESQEDEVQLFTEVNETVYATGTVNLRSGPSTNDEKVGTLNKNQSVTRIGIGTGDYSSWSKIKLSDGSEVYVASKYLTTTKPVSQSSSKPSGVGTSSTGGSTSSTNGNQQNTGSQPEQGHQTSDYDPDASMWDPFEGMTPEEKAAQIEIDRKTTQERVDGITSNFG